MASSTTTDNSEIDEQYLLLLLGDSNLPTGSFIASSGLESHEKHGFHLSKDSTLSFIRDSLHTYSRSAIPFISDSWATITSFKRGELDVQRTMEDIKRLDELYDAMTLHNVARRASKSQGVALLTLYSKGLSRPWNETEEQKGLSKLIFDIKLRVRREGFDGHLPICWGILTAALGLSLERAQFLHLFLHARGLLSAAVRLNTLGPYNAQQVLLHDVKPLVVMEAAACKDLRTGVREDDASEFDITMHGPANTWPLGEILAARHDLQHSRIFNS
ncbi:urease accessory protein UreF [Pterulicium gracile]|uniref:Urease accessory protein UreF n=1 Tax=Pterulicium gracile TaxID=1884261 RepID=A0A5C3QFZ7_9AGAR|nr:urease accessory protein UreF [Pterula gracilis]